MDDHKLAVWRCGRRGWEWVASNGYGYAHTYRTDGNGEGLYRLSIAPNGTETWDQLLGSSQFSLPSHKGEALIKISENYGVVRRSELSTLQGNF